MKLVLPTLAAAGLLVSACGPQAKFADENPQVRAAEIIKSQKERFHLYVGSSNYPPVMLDTVTGCMIYLDWEVDKNGARVLQSYYVGEGVPPECGNSVYVVDKDVR